MLAWWLHLDFFLSVRLSICGFSLSLFGQMGEIGGGTAFGDIAE